MLSVVLISITKYTLGLQAQYSKFLGALLSFHPIPTLNFSSSRASLPPASPSHITLPFQQCALSFVFLSWALLSWLSPLVSFASPPSPSLPVKVTSCVLTVFCLLLSLSALGSFRCLWLRSPSHLPLSHTLKWSCPQFIHLLKLWGWA